MQPSKLKVNYWVIVDRLSSLLLNRQAVLLAQFFIIDRLSLYRQLVSAN